MQINALCKPCLGVPGIISVRIHIDEKDCVVIEHIVHHLSLAVLIYPDLAIRFFIVFFPLYTFKPSFKLFSIFSFSFTLLQSFHSNFDRSWVPGWTDPIHIHEKHLQKNSIFSKNSGPNNINPNVHLPERALARNYIPRKTFFQNLY